MENKAPKYATWPGCSKKDNEYCLSCVWHSTLEGQYVCCDYSLEETHGIRDCRAGEFDALVMVIGRKRMMELTGYSRTGLDSTKERGRIRIRSAKRLYEETGIDITGGELRNGI